MDLETEVHQLKQRVQVLESLVANSTAPATQNTALVTPTPGPTFMPVQPAGLQQPPPPAPSVLDQPPPPAAAATVSTATHQPDPPAPDNQWPPPVPAQPKPQFEMGVESLLRWAGVALVSLAGIFLVSTAVSRGWIGPELQLLGAALGGLGLMAAAVYLAEARRPWSLALGCGGAIVLISSAIATHEWLDVISEAPAVFLALLATGAAVALAIATKQETIAIVALTVSFLVSIQTWADLGDLTGLLWLLAMIVAATALGLAMNWRGARLIPGWLFALALFLYALDANISDSLQVIGILAAVLVAALLWGSSAFAARVEPQHGDSWSSKSLRAVDYRAVALVPGWLWAVITAALGTSSDTRVGVLALVVAAAFAAVAIVSRPTDRVISTSTVLGALTLSAVGFAVLFDAPGIMVALTFQAITSYVVGRQLNDKWMRYGGYVAMAIASFAALAETVQALDSDGFATFGAMFATGIVVAAWVGGAALAHRRSDEIELPFEALFVGAWGAVMGWVGVLLLAVPQGLALISVAWAVLASAGLIVGLVRRMPIVRTAAMATLAITLFKLVSVDMAEVDVFWRVGLFFVVGMGLIVLGLKVPSLMGATPEDPEDPDAPATPGWPVPPVASTGDPSQPQGPATF